MSFRFQIRPVGKPEQGFELSCDGILPDHVHHDRLIQAVIHAVQVGSRLSGEIQVFDCRGRVAETLPLRYQDALDSMFHQAAA